MAEAARLAQDSGAAMIDINMGCPAKKVTSGYAGSHLMRDLGLAVSLIRATIAAVRIPVTLKMRLGWDGQSLNAPELGRLAEAEGIAMLTVHGRTRCQFYAAQADWPAIGRVKQAVSIPVAANGDCVSLADAAAILAQSGAPRINATGWYYGNFTQLIYQAVAALFIIVLNAVATFVILKVIGRFVPLRMDEKSLQIGDLAVHGEVA